VYSSLAQLLELVGTNPRAAALQQVISDIDQLQQTVDQLSNINGRPTMFTVYYYHYCTRAK